MAAPSSQSPTRVRIVSGKGGVGKSAVACAWALAEAQRGQRVLLAEISGQGSLPQLLQVDPVGYALREVLGGLYLIDLNPAAALHEYALMLLRFEALYRLVFDNRLVRHFLRVVPSLSELVMLGKLWFHTQEHTRGERPFDVLIIDAPATGHALALLRAPLTIMRAVPPGPLRDSTRLIWEMLTAANTQLHLVTTGEEMPVTEALSMHHAATELGIRCGPMLLNQQVTPLPAAAAAALAAAPPELAPTARATLARRQARQAQGEAELARLPAALRDAAISLPYVPDSPFRRAAIAQLADCLRPHLDRGPTGAERIGAAP